MFPIVAMAPPTRLSIRNWPTDMQPRERILQFGAHSLSNTELLAIFIGTGNKSRNAIELASDVLQHFGGFHDLFTSSFDDFKHIQGLGLAKWAQIQAAQEIAKRASLEKLKDRPLLQSQAMTRQFLQSSIGSLDHEVFACFFLDHLGYLIEYKVLFRGGSNSTFIYPRELVKEALKRNSSAVILAHNHPNGLAQPSNADLLLTIKLQKILNSIEINVLDHIIVTQNAYYSFLDGGNLKKDS
ncbi:MAG: DNA repair protein RadC [Betaproteobacteria bacterium]|jgi:DNA repair protein RadC